MVQPRKGLSQACFVAESHQKSKQCLHQKPPEPPHSKLGITQNGTSRQKNI